MRKSICFTALTAILLVILSALMLSLVSCKEEPAEKFSVNFIVDGTEYASIATAGEERISIPVSPYKTYYTFDGWYRDKDVWNDTFTADSLMDERLTADISVYARFIPVEYKATFKAGDTVVAKIPFTVETQSITPPAVPELDGYKGAWESFTLGTKNITVNAVYAIEISTAEQLRNIRLNERYILTCDIDLGGAEWTPLGPAGSPFTGSLDGDGYKITNFKITTGMHYVGLFGCSKGTLLNLGVEDFEIDVTCSGAIYAGGLVGWNNNGTITNCYATGDVSASSGSMDSSAGGLVGYNDNYAGTITNCYATGDVSATSSSYDSSYSYAGGLVGYNDNYYGTITNCYATGDVSATCSGDSYYKSDSNSYAGGLVGKNHAGTITNCYATGDVSATSSGDGSTDSSSDSYAGGLVGSNYHTITNCYATGDVSATSSSYDSSYSYAGGLVGSNYFGTITNCYATGDVSATFSSTSSSSYSYAGGLVGYNDNYYGTITNCYATGDVSVTCSGAYYSYSASYSHAGGLVGFNVEGTITNCYATGDVSATSGAYYSYSRAGGLVGRNSGTITNCYTTGDVSATSSGSSSSSSYAGGLVGYNSEGTITKCYRYSGQSFTVDINGTVSNEATNTLGTAKTMEDLKSSSFQTDTLGWSANEWTFTEGEHPVLKNVGLAE